MSFAISQPAVSKATATWNIRSACGFSIVDRSERTTDGRAFLERSVAIFQ
jgi:hypothetical protein